MGGPTEFTLLLEKFIHPALPHLLLHPIHPAPSLYPGLTPSMFRRLFSFGPYTLDSRMFSQLSAQLALCSYWSCLCWPPLGCLRVPLTGPTHQQHQTAGMPVQLWLPLSWALLLLSDSLTRGACPDPCSSDLGALTPGTYHSPMLSVREGEMVEQCET